MTDRLREALKTLERAATKFQLEDDLDPKERQDKVWDDLYEAREKARAALAKPDVCEWHRREGEQQYHTSCGRVAGIWAHEINPICHCGSKIEVKE